MQNKITEKVHVSVDRGGVYVWNDESGSSLSNMWEGKLWVGGREYISGENAMQGEKFLRLGAECREEKRKERLLEYGERFAVAGGMSPKEARRAGNSRGFRLRRGELRRWSEMAYEVQSEICRWKMRHDREVERELCHSGEKPIVQSMLENPRENHACISVKNHNDLGYLWMEMRDSRRENLDYLSTRYV